MQWIIIINAAPVPYVKSMRTGRWIISLISLLSRAFVFSGRFQRTLLILIDHVGRDIEFWENFCIFSSMMNEHYIQFSNAVVRVCQSNWPFRKCFSQKLTQIVFFSTNWLVNIFLECIYIMELIVMHGTFCRLAFVKYRFRFINISGFLY